MENNNQTTNGSFPFDMDFDFSKYGFTSINQKNPFENYKPFEFEYKHQTQTQTITDKSLNLQKVAWELAKADGKKRPNRTHFDKASIIIAQKINDLKNSALKKDARELDNTNIFPFKVPYNTDEEGEYAQYSGILSRVIEFSKNYINDPNRVGIFPQESFELYLANEAIGSSRLKAILKTPCHFLNYEGGKVKSHFALGTNIHAVIVPGFEENYAVLKETADFVSKEGCISYITQYANINGVEVDLTGNYNDLKQRARDLISKCVKKIIPKDDWEKIHKIKKSVDENVFLNYTGLLKTRTHRLNEITVYFNDGIEYSNNFREFRMKVRPDAVVTHPIYGNILISVKSSKDISPDSFCRDSYKYRYALSDYMYLRGLSIVTSETFEHLIVLAVDTENNMCQVYYNHIDDAYLKFGKREYDMALQKMVECIENNHFPDYSENAEDGHHGALRIQLPEWVNYS